MNAPSIQPLPSTMTSISPERLAGNTKLTPDQKIAEASRHFEAMLVRQILAEAQKSSVKSEFNDNSTAGSIYQDMVTNQLADSLSKSGAFGLAKTFQRQLTHGPGGTHSGNAVSNKSGHE